MCFGVVFPQGGERGGPFTAQPGFQRGNDRLIRGIQRREMRLGNVGVEADPIRLVTITLGDFQDAAGPDGFMDRLAQRSAVGVDALQHHWRIANRHEAGALEHVHQGQRAVCLTRRGGGAGKDGPIDRRHQRHLISDLEYLLDIQCRKAEKTLRPGLVSIKATVEVADNGFDVARLRIHGRQHQIANDLAGRGDQEVGPLTRKSICNPSRCVFRRGTLQRFERKRSRRYSRGWLGRFTKTSGKPTF